MIVFIVSFSSTAFSCDKIEEAGKGRPGVNSVLKKEAKKQLKYKASRMKRKFDICQNKFRPGSMNRKICNNVVYTVVGFFGGNKKSGSSLWKIVGVVVVFGLLLLGILPFFMLTSRYKKFQSYSREFKNFITDISYDSTYGYSGNVVKDASKNVKLSIRDFFIPGSRRNYTLNLDQENANGDTERVEIRSKRAYPTYDLFPLYIVIGILQRKVDYWYHALSSIPLIGGSLYRAFHSSGKQDKLSKDIYKADNFHFFMKPFKKEFSEYFKGEIMKRPGEKDEGDPNDIY